MRRAAVRGSMAMSAGRRDARRADRDAVSSYHATPHVYQETSYRYRETSCPRRESWCEPPPSRPRYLPILSRRDATRRWTGRDGAGT
jgi:hypothetical protein